MNRVRRTRWRNEQHSKRSQINRKTYLQIKLSEKVRPKSWKEWLDAVHYLLDATCVVLGANRWVCNGTSWQIFTLLNLNHFEWLYRAVANQNGSIFVRYKFQESCENRHLTGADFFQGRRDVGSHVDVVVVVVVWIEDYLRCWDDDVERFNKILRKSKDWKRVKIKEWKRERERERGTIKREEREIEKGGLRESKWGSFSDWSTSH